MRCDDFIGSGIYYKHLTDHASPAKDHQPLIIDLVDINDPGHLLSREMYDLEIHIRTGELNEAPGVDVKSTLILVANQFILTALTNEVLLAQDYETDARELIIEFDEQPNYGFFVSTEDRTRPILSFYQSELFDNKIAYQPPNEDSDVDRLSRVSQYNRLRWLT